MDEDLLTGISRRSLVKGGVYALTVIAIAAWEADTVQEILKPGVGPERIEDRSHEDGWIESRLIGLVQPAHRPLVVV